MTEAETTPYLGLEVPPRPFDTARAAGFLADLEEEVKKLEGAEGAGLKALIQSQKPLLTAILGNSPYLTRLITREPARLRLLDGPPDAAFDALLSRLKDDAIEARNEAALMGVLRRAKAEAALLIGAADIAGKWTLEEVTGALTRFADKAVSQATDWLLRDARKNKFIAELDAEEPAKGTGFLVLAMGKYGAGELNYSSDIDLVVFFEPGRVSLCEGREEQDLWVRIAKSLVKLMQERTPDGYVFRTDLRLRPDPGSTPLAVSLPAAEQYYESRGQNWERAAFIKARQVAGDSEIGEMFLKNIRPYIWRKNLDFAAIEDIHSMKRQIHAVQGHGKIAIAGHNIKLGRGGIREIEFFVQTQQLIAGGRDADLRGKRTVEMLRALAEKEWITPQAAEELVESYRFLRTLEHRLQMVEDEQTHSLPKSEEDLERIAIFSGYKDRASFDEALRAHLSRVQGHYAALFEKAPPLAEEGGSLVFTGTDDDPETVQTLSDMGFKRPSEMMEMIRGWHTGRFAATRSPRSRERLTALMPALLKALSQTADPDVAFTRFHKFIEGLPAGVQLFSLIYANPSLLGLIADICGTAPRLANHLSRNPAVLDVVLDPEFFQVLPRGPELGEGLRQALSTAQSYEGALDVARVWAREQRFRVGVRVLSGSADAEEAGGAYSAIARETIQALKPAALGEIERRYGKVPGADMAVVAMGKLGSGEMSAESDLDLIVIYDVDDGEAVSNGPKELGVTQYYAKACQQLVNALTAPTAEGKLYEVDMRLRPSGNAGPIATRYDSFAAYQEGEAWTWEHMALTRAQVAAGPAPLAQKIETEISRVLRKPRDPVKLAADVADMRARIAKEFPASDPWELKHVRGGLIDLEFIAQYLQLRYAAEMPEILSPHTRGVFEAAGRLGILPPAEADLLLHAIDLVLNLTQVVRICVTGTLNREETNIGLKNLLARVGDAPDFEALEADLRESQKAVLSLFESLIGGLSKTDSSG